VQDPRPRAGQSGGPLIALLDVLFPPRCLTCDGLDGPFCGACRAETRPARPAFLGEPIRDSRSVGAHEGPLRQAVLRLKFERKVALAEPLGRLLAAELAGALGYWRPDALVPVPIHWRRRWERGFNQSELLAAEVARVTAAQVQPLLRRARWTPPQVGQSRFERLEGVRGAFAVARGARLSGLRVVLVDDVATTGGTLHECARVLHDAGADAVFALTVTCAGRDAG